MKLFDELNDENFELFAVRNYYSPKCVDAEEFYDDLRRFKYIKRLITRYKDSGKPPTNLLMNHLIIILNVFGVKNALKMLEFKISEEQWSVVKPFLIFLGAIENTEYTGIEMDETIVNELRKI
jgi:hypothetical protein